MPDNGAIESGYPNGAADMTGNTMLFHFDDPTTGFLPNGLTFPDSSSYGNHATLSLAGASSAFVTGEWGTAWSDGVESFASITLTPSLRIGTGELTWSMWVKISPGQSCAGNKVWIGTQDPGMMKNHLWLGCSDSADVSMNCNPGNSGSRLAGFLQSEAADNAPGLCGSQRLDDGEFHHVAMVKKNVGAAGPPTTIELKLYFDGQLDGSTGSYTLAQSLDFVDDAPYVLGRFADNATQYQAEGVYDEIASFDRAQSPEEIASSYRRGALRLAARVRTCDAPDCSDRTDADFSPPLVDPPNWASPPVRASLSLPQARYAQYELALETRTTASPLVHAVELHAVAP